MHSKIHLMISPSKLHVQSTCTVHFNKDRTLQTILLNVFIYFYVFSILWHKPLNLLQMNFFVCLLFYVSIVIFRSYRDAIVTGEWIQHLGLCAARPLNRGDLYCATPALTRGLVLQSNPNIVAFNKK